MGRKIGAVATVAALATVAVVGAVGLHALTDLHVPFFDDPGCAATVDGLTVDLSVEQAQNASLIAAVAIRRGLPARAVSIALATAYQESDLRNLDHGDRDSLGLFQQRPSQGWGTAAEVRDPDHAANAFYDALELVPGYRDLEITEAAQAVQRSGFPGAYADHEADARVLASALTGNSPEALACHLDGDASPTSTDLTGRGLTDRADAVLTDVEQAFGDLPVGGFAPGGVDTGHMAGSAHYDGRAVDIFFRPVSPANRRTGWAVATYLVAQADRLGVQTVIFDDRIWRAGRDDTWRDYDPPERSGDRAVLEHRDHVHVDVFA
ncbi:heavy metal transporter [soil metagenome]